MNNRQRLEDMRAAYQSLISGMSARVVQKDGRRVEYTPADASRLHDEIKRLEVAVGLSGRRRPARLF